ncbi:MarR family transcriptional regulator [Helicobacter didelphidarum]|uniref:MarR family transcriptional regulator n=1 Tax=Helicobacter didelphidarum TaxID=2040648 RepID=A0A3D8IAI7_9HELI|nr:MarR family transcriptional regulator [Helicobacter didelphidarum]
MINSDNTSRLSFEGEYRVDSIDIRDSIGFLATKLREKLSFAFDEYTKAQYELEHKQVGILWVCLNQEISQIKLCDYIQVDKNYVRILLDNMEQKGFIYRQRNPKNRQQNLILLTDSGKEIAKKSYKYMLKMQKKLLLSHIDSDEIETLHRILFKLFEGDFDTSD